MRFVLGVLMGAAVVLWLSGVRPSGVSGLTGDARQLLAQWRAAVSPADAEDDTAEMAEMADVKTTLEAVREPAEESPEAVAEEPAEEPAAEAVAETVEETGPRALAAVWVPFHSERSASGFARRLSRALDHPFRVRREGPGAYQVVFAFDAPAQRDALLTRVAALTGEQP